MSENVRSAIVAAVATIVAALISGFVAFKVADKSAQKEVKNKINIEMPVGAIVAFYGKNPPNGWLICDGNLVTSDYPNLKTFLEDNFGSYKLPDLRGRAVIGAGQGEGLSSRPIGQEVGEENHTLTLDEMPSHFHSFDDYHYIDSEKKDPDYATKRGDDAGRRTTTKHETYKEGKDKSHNNMPPSLVVNFIIKAK